MFASFFPVFCIRTNFSILSLLTSYLAYLDLFMDFRLWIMILPLFMV